MRFVIEQYRDELIAQLRGNNDPQAIQEHEMAVAEGREAVASDLLNVLHSIPIQSIATNGPSLVGFCLCFGQCGELSLANEFSTFHSGPQGSICGVNAS